jgi:hypothetical protein
MKQWTYTDDIHDYIEIDNVKFRLNTAYDNIFQVFKYLEKKPTYETFFATLLFDKDIPRFNELTKEWTVGEFSALANYIMREYITDDIKGQQKKITDIYKDSELIFASFYFDYGISLIEKKGKMTWKEFTILCGNLSEKSPLGKAITLTLTPDKELTPEGKREKAKRNRMLNGDIDLDSQLDNLTKLLKATKR